MSYFYFFKQDGCCPWIRHQIREVYPKYLSGPVNYPSDDKSTESLKNKTRSVKFYAVLGWSLRTGKGVNTEWVKEMPYNIVESVSDLPPGAGIFNSGYDADIDELEAARKKNIPVIDKPCPWVRILRDQLKKVNNLTHQCVLLLDKGHMVEFNFRSIFPEDLIQITETDFREKIERERNGKPLYLLSYTVFREKDVLAVIDYIDETFPHPENILYNYKKTLCGWTKQGLFEEIREAVPDHDLDTVLIICSSARDRSTKSIINEVRENGAEVITVKSTEDVRAIDFSGKRVGVLIAPIPLPRKEIELKKFIETDIARSDTSAVTAGTG